MSSSGVYENEMPDNGFSDRDIELLLAGTNPEDEVLVHFAPLVRALHAEWSHEPSAERVRTFATAASEIASSAVRGPVVAEERATRPRRFGTSLRRRLAMPLAAVLLLSGMTGVAVAADDAIPGDTFYGVKMALETVGLRQGGVSERLAEASALAKNGRAAEALAHAVAAVARVGTQEDGAADALAGLEVAMARLQTPLPERGNTEHAESVRQNVVGMLQWMVENASLIGDPDAEPGEFGRGVAGWARQISPWDDDEDAAESEGRRGPPPGINPGGPPQGTPRGP